MAGNPKSWEIAKIATRLNETMPDLCDVYRRTGNTDRWGGAAEETSVHTDVPCGVAPVQAGPGSIDGVESDVVAYNVVMPLGYFMREGDRIVVTTLGGHEMRVINVERVDSYDVMLRMQATFVGSGVTS
jgi:hypothetical protein